jgi:UDP-N-acetyl-D-glucosamine dehydrogenase
MRVAIIGQGYVGLPLALACANAGHETLGIDTDPAICEKVGKGISPILDITGDNLGNALKSGNYRIENSYESVSLYEVIIICVPTPLDRNYQPDLSHLEKALRAIASNLSSNTLVINESTVSPGTTRGMIKMILDGAGVSYDLAYSPERIDPANAEWTVTNTPKLVAGLTDSATQRAASFYKSVVNSVIIGSSTEVVETAKLLENSFRLINISFINEIAQFCTALKIDVREVVKAASTKPYGFMPFYPSAGAGGHCIPIDPLYLSAKSEEMGIPNQFIKLAHDVNKSLPDYFAKVATEMLGDLKAKRILIVGIAYKPEVADVRETPAEGLITELRKRGAHVEWHDNLVQQWNGEKSVALSEDFELAILVNPHHGTALSELGSTPILDTRGGYS